ncbi:Hypothetical protein NTJ_10800 [Nesidiocoris tenuis]|uniref:Uncharacterized protein n=1 Tax=Nesidiocoris tenuis TaxID=355587 RepID=A0ABN7B0P1_9HEMI|nr:Hypothetical protein NTJ_10800 [Nesidiocoris tenuis]
MQEQIVDVGGVFFLLPLLRPLQFFHVGLRREVQRQAGENVDGDVDDADEVGQAADHEVAEDEGERRFVENVAGVGADAVPVEGGTFRHPFPRVQDRRDFDSILDDLPVLRVDQAQADGRRQDDLEEYAHGHGRLILFS